jgi:hypothetical protein
MKRLLAEAQLLPNSERLLPMPPEELVEACYDPVIRQ